MIFHKGFRFTTNSWDSYVKPSLGKLTVNQFNKIFLSFFSSFSCDFPSCPSCSSWNGIPSRLPLLFFGRRGRMWKRNPPQFAAHVLRETGEDAETKSSPVYRSCSPVNGGGKGGGYVSFVDTHTGGPYAPDAVLSSIPKYGEGSSVFAMSVSFRKPPLPSPRTIEKCRCSPVGFAGSPE